jgi:phospholipase/carboxylesterase
MHRYDIIEQGKPLSEASNALILLHGRGADPEDIIHLADEFADDTYYIAAPRATGNSWYPFSFLSPEEKNEPWLSSAIATVKRLIDSISKYLPSENIFIMGFSQGACLSLEVTARYAMRYGGIAAFSGGLIGEKITISKYNGNFDGTSIFIGNSDSDPYIPLLRTEESRQVLSEMKADVNMIIYSGMEHTIITEEIDAARQFLF